AHQEYTSAITSLESARIEAQRQQVYLVPIVQPHEAETARFPQRLENVGLVFLASLLVFLIGRLIITGIQDHLMN
ncbi:MAG TPA: capsule biosynthesis protein, partial [Kiloniellales bacterium]|nr:capsule biosynthesis protein [Kiloniellales bacterium]